MPSHSLPAEKVWLSGPTPYPGASPHARPQGGPRACSSCLAKNGKQLVPVSCLELPLSSLSPLMSVPLPHLPDFPGIGHKVTVTVFASPPPSSSASRQCVWCRLQSCYTSLSSFTFKRRKASNSISACLTSVTFIPFILCLKWFFNPFRFAIPPLFNPVLSNNIHELTSDNCSSPDTSL